MTARAGIEEALHACPAKPLAGDRLVSLDAFRGLTIFLMVVVNSSGPAVYRQFHHAPWNGWTLADTIFPSFLWIVGVAITLSIGKRLASGIPRPTVLLRALRRSAILYACGVFIYLFPAFDFARMRFTGVLQRIAVCYLIATCIYLYSGIRTQLLWTAGLLAVYWAAIMLIPVPGFGAGNLTVDGNLAHYLDYLVLGQHNWVLTQTWDPEGLLSTLPALATTLLGVLAGHLLKSKTTVSERCRWLLITGCGLLLAGSVCNIWLPINKNLWTSSFALFMAGLDCIALAALLRLIDGRGYRRWAQPFIVLGMNAIAVYMLSELLPLILIFAVSKASSGHASLEHSLDGPSILPAPVLQLLYAVIFALAMYAFAAALYRRRWFLRL
jgi:predicted acyltransferase